MTDLIREIEQEAQQDAVQTFIKNNIWGILGGIVCRLGGGWIFVVAGRPRRQALADAALWHRFASVPIGQY